MLSTQHAATTLAASKLTRISFNWNGNKPVLVQLLQVRAAICFVCTLRNQQHFSQRILSCGQIEAKLQKTQLRRQNYLIYSKSYPKFHQKLRLSNHASKRTLGHAKIIHAGSNTLGYAAKSAHNAPSHLTAQTTYQESTNLTLDCSYLKAASYLYALEL